VRSDVPRFDVGGPVVAGDVAVVSSSQFGFIAVDWRRGALAWTKPAGLHVAPPISKGEDRAREVILIGDCVDPPDVPAGETLLGCLRVVTAAGTDETTSRSTASASRRSSPRPAPRVWLDGDHAVRWRRGDQAVSST